MWYRRRHSILPLVYVNSTKAIFRQMEHLKLIESGFRRGPQAFIQCYKEKMMGHHALLVCLYYNILYSIGLRQSRVD